MGVAIAIDPFQVDRWYRYFPQADKVNESRWALEVVEIVQTPTFPTHDACVSRMDLVTHQDDSRYIFIGLGISS